MKLALALSFVAAGAGGAVAYAQSVQGVDLEALEARAASMAGEASALVEFVTSEANPHQADTQVVAEQARDNAGDVDVTGVAGIDLEGVIRTSGQGPAKAVPLFMAFASFSMPEDSLKRLIADTTMAGGVVVFRGFPDGKASAFTSAMRAAVPNGANPNIAVDPRLFRAFGVDRAPMIIAASSEFIMCDELDCVSVPPPHDRIAGNITVSYAAETFAQGNGPGALVAGQALKNLAGAQ